MGKTNNRVSKKIGIKRLKYLTMEGHFLESILKVFAYYLSSMNSSLNLCQKNDTSLSEVNGKTMLKRKCLAPFHFLEM